MHLHIKRIYQFLFSINIKECIRDANLGKNTFPVKKNMVNRNTKLNGGLR